jgi:hypothetical protein
MNHNLAICLFGPSGTDATGLKEMCLALYGENARYFESYVDTDSYRNLWLSSFKKRQFEIANDLGFTVCLAINAGEKWNAEILPILPVRLTETLYFVKGGCVMSYGQTFISPDAFFAESHLFDIACMFGLTRTILPINRKSKTIQEDFYHYLKSLKIKTECINYENSSLFERAT